MVELFAQFVTERRYLKNVTNKTIIWYQTAFQAFTRLVNVSKPTDLTRQTLQAFVFGLRERGIAPVTCNTYAKAMNAFLPQFTPAELLAGCGRLSYHCRFVIQTCWHSRRRTTLAACSPRRNLLLPSDSTQGRRPWANVHWCQFQGCSGVPFGNDGPDRCDELHGSEDSRNPEDPGKNASVSE